MEMKQSNIELHANTAFIYTYGWHALAQIDEKDRNREEL